MVKILRLVFILILISSCGSNNGLKQSKGELVGVKGKKYFPEKPFDGGFKITKVTNTNGSNLSHTINQTMMRINLPKPLGSGEKFSFKISW